MGRAFGISMGLWSWSPYPFLLLPANPVNHTAILSCFSKISKAAIASQIPTPAKQTLLGLGYHGDVTFRLRIPLIFHNFSRVLSHINYADILPQNNVIFILCKTNPPQ